MKSCAGLMLLIALAAFFNADAQTKKGSFMIGGSGSLINSKLHQIPPNVVSANPNTTFSISPTVGYFFINNLMTGIATTFGYGWNIGSSNPRNTNVNAGAGPQLRYYFPFGKFAIFPEVAGLYTASKFRSIGEGQNGVRSVDTFKQSTTSYRAGVGMAWFVASNVGIEGVVAYRQVNYSGDDPWRSQLYITLAIQFYIPTKN